MKKLMDDKLGRNNSSHDKEVESSTIEAEHKVGTSRHVSKEVMVRGTQTIRRLIGWDNPVNATTIRAYLMSEHGEEKPCDASMEVTKKKECKKKKEGDEPTSKKKTSSDGKFAPKKGLAKNTR